MDVIQIPPADQHRPIPNIRSRTFFIIRERLDADALRGALDTLIRRHWRKLGGRLVQDPRTELYAYHVPPIFAEDYAIFRWSQADTDEPIDKAAPFLAAPSTDGVAFLPPMKDFDAVFRPSEWPYDFADDPADSPILYVHVTLMRDASVLTTSMPHLVGDQLGFASLMKAWLGVLDGKAPPAMVGYDDDPLAIEKPYSQYKKGELYQKGKMRVKTRLEPVLVALGLIPDFIREPSEVHPVIFFSLPMIKALRARVAGELKQKHESDCTVSDGDILTGILTKFAYMSRKSSKMITLSQTLNLRGRVPTLSGPEREGFVHNALISASARFRISAETPLSEVAYHNRRAIEETVAPGYSDRVLAVVHEMVRRKQPMHTCEPFEGSYAVVSWPAAWKGLDLSSAVQKSEKRAGATVAKTFILGQSGERKTPRRYHSIIMSRCEKGYWVDFGCTPKTLQAIKAYLEKDPKLEAF